jgi:putative methionine-R-sulfoxide reductase with GAF domain
LTNQRFIHNLKHILSTGSLREGSAVQLAKLIQEARSYRWVGIYEVVEQEIVLLGSSNVSGDAAEISAGESTESGYRGPSHVPAYPRFPVSQGLCGAAVSSGKTILVGDVTKDPRYLTTFGSTRSEIVVPVLSARNMAVLGVIDVESDRMNAFTPEDQAFLEECAGLIGAAWALTDSVG